MPLNRSSTRTESHLFRLLHLFSPTGWLVVAAVSVVLASGSALLLAARRDIAPREAPGKAFDMVEQFMRDTIRLSFKDRLFNDTSHAVFVAPKGILNGETPFKWIEDPRIFESSGEEAAPAAIAPPRVLDPNWVPEFSVISPDKKKP